MTNTYIEWCDSTLNPITGCYNSCPYCYARRIANRFAGCEAAPDGKTAEKIVYLKERQHCIDSKHNRRPAAYPYGFTPTFHEYRLKDIVTKGLGKTIFICSMADMFAPWIPDEWIEKVFDACKEADNHRYLFLTKYPERYLSLCRQSKLPDGNNFWYGSTCAKPDDKVFFAEGYHTFISMEPILADFGSPSTWTGAPHEKAEWIILGAETGPRATKVVPERSWVEPVVEEFKKAGKPVFMKNSMKAVWGDDILTEFPWED